MAIFFNFLLLKMCWNTYFYSVFWTSPKICPKKGHQKNDNFSHFPKHRLIKKTVLLQPPFWPKNVFFFKLFVWKSKTLMLNKKHNLKSGNSKDKKKELETKKDRKPKKREKIDEDKTCNLIFWCCSFHERKQRRKRKKERDKNKEPKESKKERQEGRKKEKKKRERQRKRNRKRGKPKKAKGERKRNTENKQKMPFSRGKRRFFFVFKKPKKPKNKKNKKQQKQIRRV